MELQDTLGTFAREGIPVVALKGVVLAVLVYSEPALRPMQDVDLLVRSGDLEAADAALRGLGYASHPSRPPSTWYKEYHHHLAPYLSSDGTVVVEHPSRYERRNLPAGLSVPFGDTPIKIEVI
jgi:hypothetical protein